VPNRFRDSIISRLRSHLTFARNNLTGLIFPVKRLAYPYQGLANSIRDISSVPTKDSGQALAE